MANSNLDALQLNGNSAADSVGLILGSGTAATPATTATADKNFIEFRVQNSATSGDGRGMYLREYLTGAGGGGEALRVFTTVDDIAGATARGMHCSLNFDTSGSVTGKGVAGSFTLHMPTTAFTDVNSTLAAIEAEIWSDGSTSDPGGNFLSAIRVVNAGNATGMADVDDDAFLLDIQGFTDATGNMFLTTAPSTLAASLRIRVGTTLYYLPLYSGSS